MILFVAAASSAAWTSDATFIIEAQNAHSERRAITIEMPDIIAAKAHGRLSIEETPGCSIEAGRIGNNSLIHLLETDNATPATLTIERPLADDHSVHADGKFHFIRAGA